MQRILCLLLACLFVLTCAQPCVAKEAPTPEPKSEVTVPADDSEGAKRKAPLLTQRQFSSVLEHGPAGNYLLAMLFLKYALAALGLFFLIQWIRESKPMGVPVLTHGPTTPLELGDGIWIVLGALILPSFVLLALGHSQDDPLIERRAREFAASFAVGIPIVALVTMRRWRLTKSRLPSWGSALNIGFQGLCVGTFFMLGIALLTAQIMAATGHQPRVQRLVQEGLSSSTVSWMVAAFGVFVAPLVEEVLFRGLLYPALKTAFAKIDRPAVWSAIVTSFVFALIHGSLTAFGPLFALAMVLAWVMEKTNSLAACVLLHAMNNVIAAMPQVLHHIA